MSEHHVYPVSATLSEQALINNDRYNELYEKSVSNPEEFWSEMGDRLDWIKKFTEVKDVSYEKNDLHIRWYGDGTLNACVNCVDRHLKDRADQTAIIFEGDDPNVSENITYQKLYEEVCRFSNVLKNAGAKKGDRITLYMPM